MPATFPQRLVWLEFLVSLLYYDWVYQGIPKQCIFYSPNFSKKHKGVKWKEIVKEGLIQFQG